MNIILTGFRGSGKSTVGRILAQRLKLEFADTDREIERRSGRTISAIFQAEGEPGFRKLEKSAVLEILHGDRRVIALGGGAVVDGELAAEARKRGIVVLLSAGAEELHRRIERDANSASTRPALTESTGLAQVKELLESRREAYAGAAHIEVDTGGLSPGEVADRVEAALKEGEFSEIFSQIIT